MRRPTVKSGVSVGPHTEKRLQEAQRNITMPHAVMFLLEPVEQHTGGRRFQLHSGVGFLHFLLFPFKEKIFSFCFLTYSFFLSIFFLFTSLFWILQLHLTVILTTGPSDHYFHLLCKLFSEPQVTFSKDSITPNNS